MIDKCKYCGAPGYADRQEYCARKPKPMTVAIPDSVIDKIIEQVAVELGAAKPTGLWKYAESLSEQMQGDLEPLPGVKKWDDTDNMDVLKHGRE